jgi:hypothetical protein
MTAIQRWGWMGGLHIPATGFEESRTTEADASEGES